MRNQSKIDPSKIAEKPGVGRIVDRAAETVGRPRAGRHRASAHYPEGGSIGSTRDQKSCGTA